MARNKPFNKQQTEPHKRSSQVAGLKVPPCPVEAEQSVLDGLVLDNEHWDDVAERVVADDSYTRPHRHIFTETARLQESGSPIDLTTPAESPERQGQFNSVGGSACLAELSENTPSVAGVSACVGIMCERVVVCEMISVASEIAEASFDSQGCTGEDLSDPAEFRILRIAESRVNKDERPKNIADVPGITVAHIEQLFQQPHDGVTGVNTGYDDLNKKTAGLQPSDLIIVTARPSMGEAAFTANLVENAAALQDKPVLISSLGTPSEQTMMRPLASLLRVNQTKVRTGQLDDEGWAYTSGTMGILLEKRDIYIGDSSGLTPAKMHSHIHRTTHEHGGTEPVTIDYLQLTHASTLSDNRMLEIVEISRPLKALAEELNVPVVVLSQLNRSLEQRADKRPVNSDLRGSDSIEQNADLIMFTCRDEVYHENSDLRGIAEIIIGEQHNDSIRTVRLAFNGQWSRFDNYAGSQYDSEQQLFYELSN